MFNRERYNHERDLGHAISAFQQLLTVDLFHIMHYGIARVHDIFPCSWTIAKDGEYYSKVVKLRCGYKNGRVVLKKYLSQKIFSHHVVTTLNGIITGDYCTDVHHRSGMMALSSFNLLLSMTKVWCHIQHEPLSVEQILFKTIKSMILMYMSDDNLENRLWDNARDCSVDNMAVAYAFEHHDTELLTCLHGRGLIVDDSELLNWCVHSGNMAWYAETFKNSISFNTYEEELML